MITCTHLQLVVPVIFVVVRMRDVAVQRLDDVRYPAVIRHRFSKFPDFDFNDSILIWSKGFLDPEVPEQAALGL